MTSCDSPGANAPTAQGRAEHAPRTVTGEKPGGVGTIRVVPWVCDGPALTIVMT